MYTLKFIYILKKSSPEDIFPLIWERERGRRGEREEAGERERVGGEREKHQCERNIDWLPPICAPTGDWTCNWGMSPDQELDQQPFSAQNDAPTNWAMRPGLESIYFHWWFLLCCMGVPHFIHSLVDRYDRLLVCLSSSSPTCLSFFPFCPVTDSAAVRIPLVHPVEDHLEHPWQGTAGS